MASSLEENLCCSICLNIYSDPVVLSCSHSCCECLRQCWTEETHRACPLCRSKVSKDPPPNLVLKNVCEAYVQSQEGTATGQQGTACSIQEALTEQKKELTQTLPDLADGAHVSSERREAAQRLLGAEPLSEGLHRWDVDVSHSRYWELGVGSRCQRLPGVLSELWKIGVSQDQCKAGTLSGRPTALSLPRAPRTVRLESAFVSEN
ncbi:E3 ubiquitin-protein ligase TRIM11-like [Eucyclogobius newberryi]|uniref:E3 ubiquitin-protein ligase TRIM11-like n=1 Tax=Eucyclogobius newberryi TaxID=166745 RepID=UPI003B5BE17C